MACKKCGREIGEFDLTYTVNDGLPTEFDTCESCHDDMVDKNEIIQCDACGEWFTNDVLKTETIHGNSFTPCPSCGKDIVEGMTREEFAEEYAPCKYALDVTWVSGRHRGFTVEAYGVAEAYRKLLDSLEKREDATGIHAMGIHAITCSLILMKEDEIK